MQTNGEVSKFIHARLRFNYKCESLSAGVARKSCFIWESWLEVMSFLLVSATGLAIKTQRERKLSFKPAKVLEEQMFLKIPK